MTDAELAEQFLREDLHKPNALDIFAALPVSVQQMVRRAFFHVLLSERFKVS